MERYIYFLALFPAMTNTAKLQYPNRRQFLITLPQALARAKGWEKGDILEFVLDDQGNIILKKVKEGKHAT